MKEYFTKLYRFNEWANVRVIGCLKTQAVGDEKILSVMGHVLAAQFLWLHRIEGLPAPDVKLWGNYTLETLERMAAEINQRWIDFVANTENFNRMLSYKNYTGDAFTNNVEHIMMHLVNHCSYHRGQVAMLLRQKGFEPVNTDFITYDRVVTGQWKD
jgi:uncharacterized damage-inducible protein DinB